MARAEPTHKTCLKAPAFGLLRWPVRLLFLGVAAPPSLVPSAMRAQCSWEHWDALFTQILPDKMRSYNVEFLALQ